MHSINNGSTHDMLRCIISGHGDLSLTKSIYKLNLVSNHDLTIENEQFYHKQVFLGQKMTEQLNEVQKNVLKSGLQIFG